MSEHEYRVAMASRSECRWEELVHRLSGLRTEIDSILATLAEFNPKRDGAPKATGEPCIESDDTIENFGHARDALAGAGIGFNTTSEFLADTVAPARHEDEAYYFPPNSMLHDEKQAQLIATEPANTGAEYDRPICPVSSFDDLALISSIDCELASQLNQHGVWTFNQIAAWSRDDVSRVSKSLALNRRISKENWIEQAAILSAGSMTSFADGRTTPPTTNFECAGDDNRIDQVTNGEAVPISTIHCSPSAPQTSAVISLHEAVLARHETKGARGKQFRRRVAVNLAACLAASLFLAYMVAADREILGGTGQVAFSSTWEVVKDAMNWSFSRIRRSAELLTGMDDAGRILLETPAEEAKVAHRYRAVWPAGS